jgi:uncharacterized protein YprB with RNaseH-like and TPR domain
VSDIGDQLAALRRKVARIDKKYAAGLPARPAPPTDSRPARYFIEEWMTGEVVETPYGHHFETERLWERHRRHGSMDISNLFELPEDLLGPLGQGEVPARPATRWAFLDTETTGLAGGTGTYAFLIGVGRICPEGFRVRQFFMRDYGEESSLLWGLAQHLAEFDVLITYNGKTYDQPLLETRYRMARMRPPFGRLAHLDLLHGARRLWKLRLESCRLVDLENQILGVEREGDLPGEMIPYVYFEYLRTQQAWRVVPIFHHNAMDLLATACLAAIVPLAHREPEAMRPAHGADLIGLARWFLNTALTAREGASGAEAAGHDKAKRSRGSQWSEQHEQALALMRRAVELGLPDELLFRALWDIAALEKRLGREAAAVAVLSELASTANPYRVPALEALAKHYEHGEPNLATALEMVRAARAVADSDDLARRQARLERRMARPQSRRLL